MKELIRKSAAEVVKASEKLIAEDSLEFIEKASQMIADSLEKGGKLLIGGNGGSLCDAMHFAEEMTGFFRKKRKALAALAMADPGHISCVANDEGFGAVYSRYIESLAGPHDIVILLTTSGNSENLYNALQTAKNMGVQTISFLGKTGGLMKGLSDLEWVISGYTFSDRIQELHMAAIHIIIQAVEEILQVYEGALV